MTLSDATIPVPVVVGATTFHLMVPVENYIKRFKALCEKIDRNKATRDDEAAYVMMLEVLIGGGA